MKRKMSRVVSLALVLVLIFSLSVSAFAAEGTVTPVEEPVCVFLPSENGSGTARIRIAYGSKNFAIKRSSVSVLGAGTKLVGFEKEFNTHFNEEDPNAVGAWKTEEDNAYCNYYVSLLVSRTGTAVVRYKIGSVECKLKVKILPYENPVRTITMQGVNKGKNFASRTRSQYSGDKALPLKATVMNAKLTVKAASGWKVSLASVMDMSTSSAQIVYCNNPANSASVLCPKLNVNRDYVVYIELYHPATNFTRDITYYIHGVKAKT